jgi:lipoprotein-releasing system ATP-binding protein
LRRPFQCAPRRRLAHDEHRAVVGVTHDAGFAEAADRRVHMLDGRIVAGA